MRLKVLSILIVAMCGPMKAPIVQVQTEDRVFIKGHNSEVKTIARMACGDREAVMIDYRLLPWEGTRLYEYQCVD